MKRFVALLVIFVLAGMLGKVYSAEILLTPETKSNAQNKIWSGVFQLAWNDFMTWMVHDEVKFVMGNPEGVSYLNKKHLEEDDITKNCYYKHASKVSKRTKRQIQRTLNKKFELSSDLLKEVSLTPRNDRVILYAFTNKNIDFSTKFDELGEDVFGIEQKAVYYGINPQSKAALRNCAKILFYNSPDDYAVELKSTENDTVYLYKNNINKDFTMLYDEMMRKESRYYGDTHFSEIDELKIPHLKFMQEKLFEDLSAKRVKGLTLVLDKAFETINFSMDNTGEKLKNKRDEALSYDVASMVLPKPRLLYFNDTFVLFVRSEDSRKPYFAIRVQSPSRF